MILYALFAGADFGAGFWDLIAGGDVRGRQPRALIDRAIAPVWEANHVWLIFVLVVMWTAFPSAYSSILSTLFIPFTLAALGIVMRGASFAFRKASVRLGVQRAFGAIFAAVVRAHARSSSGPPSAGSRRAACRRATPPGDFVTSWANPASVMVGALAVAVCAYLASVYLIGDARRVGDVEMERYFTRRALAAGVVTGALALAGILVLRNQAEYVYDRLIHEALPLVLVSAACGVAMLVLLALRSARAAPACWAPARWSRCSWPGASPSGPTCSRRR